MRSCKVHELNNFKLIQIIIVMHCIWQGSSGWAQGVLREPPPKLINYCAAFRNETDSSVRAPGENTCRHPGQPHLSSEYYICLDGFRQGDLAADGLGRFEGCRLGFFQGYRCGVDSNKDSIYEEEWQDGFRSATELSLIRPGVTLTDFLLPFRQQADEDGKSSAKGLARQVVKARFREFVHNGYDPEGAPSRVPQTLQVHHLDYQEWRTAWAALLDQLGSPSETPQILGELRLSPLTLVACRRIAEQSNLRHQTSVMQPDRVYVEALECRTRPSGACRDADQAWDWWSIYKESRQEAPYGEVPVNELGEPLYNPEIIFKWAFQKGYSHNCGYYFSNSFADAFYEGKRRGQDDGVDVARKRSFDRGRREGLQKLIQADLQKRFESALKEEHPTAFLEFYDRQMATQDFEVTLTEVKGQDGLIQPGEPFSLRFYLYNYGGAGGGFTAQPAQTGVIQPRGHRGSIGRLCRKEVTVSDFGIIDPSLPTDYNLPLQLIVKGDSGIEAMGSKRVTVKTMVAHKLEDGGPRIEVDSLDGSGAIYLTVINISKAPTPQSVMAKVTLGDGQVHGASLDPLDAGQEKEFKIQFDGKEPLDLLRGMSLEEIKVTVGDRLMFRFVTTLKLRSPQWRAETARLLGSVLEREEPLPEHWGRVIEVMDAAASLCVEDIRIDRDEDRRPPYLFEELVAVRAKHYPLSPLQSQAYQCLANRAFKRIKTAATGRQRRTALPVLRDLTPQGRDVKNDKKSCKAFCLASPPEIRASLRERLGLRKGHCR